MNEQNVLKIVWTFDPRIADIVLFFCITINGYAGNTKVAVTSVSFRSFFVFHNTYIFLVIVFGPKREDYSKVLPVWPCRAV